MESSADYHLKEEDIHPENMPVQQKKDNAVTMPSPPPHPPSYNDVVISPHPLANVDSTTTTTTTSEAITNTLQPNTSQDSSSIAAVLPNKSSSSSMSMIQASGSQDTNESVSTASMTTARTRMTVPPSASNPHHPPLPPALPALSHIIPSNPPAYPPPPPPTTEEEEMEEPDVDYYYDTTTTTKNNPGNKLKRIFTKRRGGGKQQQQQQQDEEQDGVMNDLQLFPQGVELSEINSTKTEEEDTVTGNWSIEDDNSTLDTSLNNNHRHRNHHHHHHHRYHSKKHPQQHPAVSMSAADIAICQQLDAEYERALEERDVTFAARYQSVRQSTCFSIFFMATYISLGTVFFQRQAADWDLEDSLLFTVYTITTVGYGHLEVPDTPAFQLYTIFFIFIGIATLTIMVAQVYQCLELEAQRAATSTDSRSSMRIWLAAHVERAKHQAKTRASATTTTTTGSPHNKNSTAAAAVRRNSHNNTNNYSPSHRYRAGVAVGVAAERAEDYWPNILERLLIWWDHMLTFLKDNEFGRGLAVVLPFAGLIFVGATIVGTLEGWTWIESVYFSCVSLTTVGFGDYYPTRPASIWFCIIWLPFSIGFMSLYLANVAAFYIRISNNNILRIERHLRRKIQRRKERAELERLQVLQRALRGQQQQQQQQQQQLEKQQEDGHTNNSTDAASDEFQMDPTLSSISNRESRVDKLRKNVNRWKGFSTVPNNENSIHSKESSVPLSPTPDDGRPHLFGSGAPSKNRRDRILHNSMNNIIRSQQQQQQQSQQQQQNEDNNGDGNGDSKLSPQVNKPMTGTSMATMKDVLNTVHKSNAGRARGSHHQNDDHFFAGPEAEFLTVRSSKTMKESFYTSYARQVLKPSFALRALVQERFAEIIAADIAGYQSNIEIKEYTLSVTIGSIRQTADKWLVPRRARKAFRAVAFEALYFVGEHALITKGAEALFSLTPLEFHQIFAPLLAAFGDAETMDEWLAHTDVLADVDLRGASIVDLDPLSASAALLEQEENLKNNPDTDDDNDDDERNYQQHEQMSPPRPPRINRRMGSSGGTSLLEETENELL